MKKIYNYTNSDVFNSFIEISDKKGLISLAEDTNNSREALEKNPRADSLTKDKISKLYNLKTETPKEMSYKNNIMEIAHPKPAFIQDSYDKLNGLVENNIERQNAMLKIVNKKTNGLLMQHKYAQDEMVKSLLRVANYLDLKNLNEISSVADECIESMAVEFYDSQFKEAKSNLINSLIKTSSLLDNCGENKLSNMALACIEEVENY